MAITAERKGKWRDDELSALPDRVRKCMCEKTPDWDWTIMVDGGVQWFIARLFDDLGNGPVETDRIACHIIATIDMV